MTVTQQDAVNKAKIKYPEAIIFVNEEGMDIAIPEHVQEVELYIGISRVEKADRETRLAQLIRAGKQVIFVG